MQKIVDVENGLKKNGLPQNYDDLLSVKKMGFSDRRIAKLTHHNEEEIRLHRHKLGLHPVYKRIDSCAGEFNAPTPYMYSCYE